MRTNDEKGVRREYPYRCHLGDGECQAGPQYHIDCDRQRDGQGNVDPEEDQDSVCEPFTCSIGAVFDDGYAYGAEGD